MLTEISLILFNKVALNTIVTQIEYIKSVDYTHK